MDVERLARNLSMKGPAHHRHYAPQPHDYNVARERPAELAAPRKTANVSFMRPRRGSLRSCAEGAPPGEAAQGVMHARRRHKRAVPGSSP